MKNEIETVVDNYIGAAQKRLGEKENWNGMAHIEGEEEQIEDQDEKQEERMALRMVKKRQREEDGLKNENISFDLSKV